MTTRSSSNHQWRRTKDDETKRPPGNVGGLFLRENSSNGGETRQNFLAKSYGPKKRGVKEIFVNK
jgi:hypothetical protein